MDENYLDNLLNEFSLDKEIDNTIEDELDDQIAKEKASYQKANTRTQEDLFNDDLERDAAESLWDQDLMFSEHQMDELDALDDLADLDMGDLDFSDIDFDDLDVTKLDGIDDSDIDDLIKDFEGSLEIKDSFDDSLDLNSLEVGNENQPLETQSNEEETIIPQQDNLNEDSFNADEFLDSLLDDSERKAADESSPIVELEDTSNSSAEADITEDNVPSQQDMETIEDLDSLLESLSEDGEAGYDALEAMDGFSDFGKVNETEESEPQEESPGAEPMSYESLDGASDDGNLDDLFSLLDLDENEQSEVMKAQEEQANSDMLEGVEGLEDIEDLSEDSSKAKKKKKKKNNKKKKDLVDILFGDDEELTEEQIAEMEAAKKEKKAAKKAKKAADKEAKKAASDAAKAEKKLKDGQKKKADADKKRVKAEIKAKKKAEELANAEPEKKLNSAAVIFVFSFVLGGVGVLYLASNNFNYTQAIQKATNYFESQKYHKAYDEIKGVDVKEKDQDLKDRIYTVMYVERLYESYENNAKLGFYEKSLDSLLRGVSKYYEHYDEAVELGIVSDIDYSFSKIQNELMDKYGITVDRAKEINKLDNDEYVLMIRSYVEGNQDKLSSEDSEQPSQTDTQNQEDAILDNTVNQSKEKQEEDGAK